MLRLAESGTLPYLYKNNFPFQGYSGPLSTVNLRIKSRIVKSIIIENVNDRFLLFLILIIKNIVRRTVMINPRIK